MTRKKKPTDNYKGVDVEVRKGARRMTYFGRYTTNAGKRVKVPMELTWQAAFDSAVSMQQAQAGAGWQDLSMGHMSFLALVNDYYVPTLSARLQSPVSHKNVRSHLGDGTGKATRKGAKNERAAKYQLRYYFGRFAINQISPALIDGWVAKMFLDGYEWESVKVKLGMLSSIMEIARVNGWISINPCSSVKLPKRIAKPDDDRTFSFGEWALVRSRITSETAGLLVDVALDCGLRFGEVTALRPAHLKPADGVNVQHLHIVDNVIWPGHQDKDDREADEAWLIKPVPKGRRDRRVAVSQHVFEALVDYVEKYQVSEDALIFDYGRMRGEWMTLRQQYGKEGRDLLPQAAAPKGMYRNPQTGKTGSHGKPGTYRAGCHCVPCTNANSQYVFWKRRAAGAKTASPWLEPDFIKTRSDAIDPVSNQWFRTNIFKPAIKEARLDWDATPHDMRHAMITWVRQAGAPTLVVQNDVGHANSATTDGYTHRMAKFVVTGDRLPFLAKVYAEINGVSEEAATASSSERKEFLAWVDTVSDEQLTAWMTLVRPAAATARPLRAV